MSLPAGPAMGMMPSAHLRKQPSAALLTLLAQAAALRAAGLKWESVAERVGRSPETCRRWPQTYPQDWLRLFTEAERALIRDTHAEGLAVLRNLLREQDWRPRLGACKLLAQMRQDLARVEAQEAAEGPGLDPVIVRFVTYLQSLTPEQFQAQLQEFREQDARAAAEAAARAAAQAAAATPASDPAPEQTAPPPPDRTGAAPAPAAGPASPCP